MAKVIIKCEGNVTTYAMAGVWVEVRSDAYSFTVYDANYGDKPVGTISRPRRDKKDGQNGQWAAYDINGNRTSSARFCMSAVSALRSLFRTLEGGKS